ncbi:MAG: hypothetical protein NTV49_00195 [Kiritimatiellaeota bacterium]|nr:hypothetical protein [Kiritimatiellota bacterium]
MNTITAIALLAIRTAVRSRVVVMLLGMLALAIIGIPLTVKSDGTLGGYVQILIRYTLGCAELLLSLATVWVGVAAVSLEIQDQQMHLLVTKPVHKLQIWLGKWLGLVAINVLALALCGGATYGLLRWTTRPGRLSAAERQTLNTEILVTRQTVSPQPFAVEDQARQVLEERQAQGALPANVPAANVYKAIRDSLLIEAHAVRSGAALTWTCPPPPAAEPERPFHLRYKISSSQLAPGQIAGRWSVGRAAGGRRYEVTQTNTSQGVFSLTVPATARIGTGALTVTYANVHAQPVTVLFDPRDSLRLLFYAGPWETNLLRALLLMACRLAFIAALGVTAGCLFSMPVAAFAALVGWLVIGSGASLRSLAMNEGVRILTTGGAAPSPSLAGAALRLFYRGMQGLLQPLQTVDALALVASGQNVAWDLVARVFAVQVLIYGGLLMLAGAGALHRRELALPMD